MPREDKDKLVVIDESIALDSTDESISVAEARHMARAHMLVQALNALHEIGMNSDNKTADRNVALKFIVEFASEAQGNGGKTIGKLSPEAARLIAKLGLQKAGRRVLSDDSEGERVAASEDYSQPRGDSDPGKHG